MAALAVFLFHYGGGAQSHWLPLKMAGYAVKFGAAGVSLFFVLSGFLIGGILWDGYGNPGWWKTFYARRSLRIFPLYYLALGIAVVAALLAHATAAQVSGVWPYLLYLQNFPGAGEIMHRLPPVVKLYHFWSLAVEEQFYLLWPFILWPFAGHRVWAKRACMAIWILSLLFRLFLVHQNLEMWNFMVMARAGELSIGTWLALSLRGTQAEWAKILRWAPSMLAVAFIAICIDAWIGWHDRSGALHSYPTTVFGFSIYSVFFVCLVALCFKQGPVRSFFSLGALRGAGKISYGIYVYHVLFMPFYYWIVARMLPHASHNATEGVIFVVALSGTLLIASASFYGFESRVSSLKRFFPSQTRLPEQALEVSRSEIAV